ncbi:RHS repeat domain-containing protein [Providencia stuartii]
MFLPKSDCSLRNLLCIKIGEQVNCIEINLKPYCYEEHASYYIPLDVTNEQGNTVWSGKYERFGFVRSSPLSFYSDPEREMESFEQNLRYAGQYFDNETGLHFNTFRFYDPQIGRFIMPDPIGLLGRINLYQYAVNLMELIDPLD